MHPRARSTSLSGDTVKLKRLKDPGYRKRKSIKKGIIATKETIVIFLGPQLGNSLLLIRKFLLISQEKNTFDQLKLGEN